VDRSLKFVILIGFSGLTDMIAKGFLEGIKLPKLAH